MYLFQTWPARFLASLWISILNVMNDKCSIYVKNDRYSISYPLPSGTLVYWWFQRYRRTVVMTEINMSNNSFYTTLRINIKLNLNLLSELHEKWEDKEFVVEFDFLGKDSIRYQNWVAVNKRVFKNLKIFIKDKEPGDDLFDRLNTTKMNEYLGMV